MDSEEVKAGGLVERVGQPGVWLLSGHERHGIVALIEPYDAAAARSLCYEESLEMLTSGVLRRRGSMLRPLLPGQVHVRQPAAEVSDDQALRHGKQCPVCHCRAKLKTGECVGCAASKKAAADRRRSCSPASRR